jgi:hypothetical protein
MPKTKRQVLLVSDADATRDRSNDRTLSQLHHTPKYTRAESTSLMVTF